MTCLFGALCKACVYLVCVVLECRAPVVSACEQGNLRDKHEGSVRNTSHERCAKAGTTPSVWCDEDK